MADVQPPQSATHQEVSGGPALPFPVVGIGASAGGLEALQDLFSGLHRDSPMAYVVIQHLSPDFKSMMLEILARHTALTVVLPEDGTAVAPGQVYLIPPTQDLVLEEDRIRLRPRQEDGGLHHPIDTFLESLAKAQQELAVAVILSGTGSDGTRGARRVHQAGGTVIVQEPSSAKFDGMPRSAVSTGVADLVLGTFAIAEQLNDWPGALESAPVDREREPLSQLFELVASETRVDLSVYKEGTLVRRIHRRMQATDRTDMRDYADLVASSEAERRALCSDLLIGVTEFFRDTDAWNWLSENVLYELTTERTGELRMWVVGCSTGPEAYTLAMMVNEIMEARGLERPYRIFATDANAAAIKEAMAGTYDEALMAGVPEDLRDRYFRQVGEAWTVRRFLRDRITFAVHNVITDPPFTRLSLVTCRNMLIYLRPEAQRPVIARMHFGLHEGGILMLGSSETVGDRKGYFEPLNLKWKIFRARGSSSELASLFGGAIGVVRHLHDTAPRRPATPKGHTQAANEFYIPPGVGVDPAFEIQHFFGHVTPYLKLPEGRANLNLLNMLPPAVSVFVSSTARRVRASEEPALIPGVELDSDVVDIRILLSKQTPVDQGDRGLLVFFEQSRRGAVSGASPNLDLSDASRERISRLEDELMVTRENLRTAVEDLEAANEELQATNEELIASNEELQSTNEELQSVNEELFSVNTEYQEKIEELEYLANDLENLLRSIDVGALFLDKDLRVRRFNDTVLRLIPLKAQDIGRDFDDFMMRVNYPSMREDLIAVRDGAAPMSTELLAPDGVHWRIVIRNFDGGGNRQLGGGVIVTFHDATTLRMQEDQIGDLAANAVAVGLAGVGVMVVDTESRQVRLSEVAEELLGVSSEFAFGYDEVKSLLDSAASDVDPGGIVKAGDALRNHERPDGSQVLLRAFAQRATNTKTDTEQLIVVLQEVR